MKKLIACVLTVAVVAGSMGIAFAQGETAQTKSGNLKQRAETRVERIREEAKKIQKGNIIRWLMKLKDEKLSPEAKELKNEIIVLYQKIGDNTATLREQLKQKKDALKVVLKSKELTKEEKKAAVQAAKPELQAITKKIREIAAPDMEVIKVKVKELRALLKVKLPPTTPELPTE